MCKRIITVITISGLLTAGYSAYRNRLSFGIGVQAGEPSGITLKYWPSSNQALDLTAGWNPFTNRPVAQFAYLIHFPLNSLTLDISPYSGMGIVVGSNRFLTESPDSSAYLAGRVPIGVELFSNHLGVYGEVDVLMNLLPDNRLGIAGGVGLRFYF